MSKQNPLRSFGDRLPGIQYVDRPGAYAFLSNQMGQLAVIKTSFGLFLPGGGLDPGEDELAGLARELREEIGYELVKAQFLVRAAQYHWSAFYKSYFRKIGAFFTVEALPPPRPIFAEGHSLLWLPHQVAATDLSQEFQRWATVEWARG